MEENKMENPIEVVPDTHKPGSLEMMLWFLDHSSPTGAVYSTGDHIPSGMKGPDRELCDYLRSKKNVKDVQPELQKAYETDPEFRRASDEHYQKTIANMEMRRQALNRWRALAGGYPIFSCVGNQDGAVSKKMKSRYNAQTVFEAFEGTQLVFVDEPKLFHEGETGVLLVPYTPNLKKDSFEEASEKLAEKRLEERDVEDLKRFMLLSHQSIDCTGMGLPEKKRDTYTDPGNRALITHYYELVRELVGAKNVQMAHGHHHTPYMQYDFNGSKVHNLDIGDILYVDPFTGETEVKHVLQRF